MNKAKREALASAGYVVNDFAGFLGMDEAEARVVALRADLGAEIRRIRAGRKLTQAAFGKAVGATQSQVARMEIGAPEITIDRMLDVYYRAGGNTLALPGDRTDGASSRSSETSSKKTPVEN